MRTLFMLDFKRSAAQGRGQEPQRVRSYLIPLDASLGARLAVHNKVSIMSVSSFANSSNSRTLLLNEAINLLLIISVRLNREISV